MTSMLVSLARRSAPQILVLGVILAGLHGSAAGEKASGDLSERRDADNLEFFEKSVRPILVERCQACHGASKQKGGLRLDSRQAILAGGSTGPAVIPGKPEDSLLVDAINYGEQYQMPPKSKLPAAEI